MKLETFIFGGIFKSNMHMVRHYMRLKYIPGKINKTAERNTLSSITPLPRNISLITIQDKVSLLTYA